MCMDCDNDTGYINVKMRCKIVMLVIYYMNVCVPVYVTQDCDKDRLIDRDTV